MIQFLKHRRESSNPRCKKINIGYSQNEMIAKPANRIRKPAFTLIEIILVIGIIGVLVVIGTESFKKSREQLAFEGSVNRVVGLLQKARGLSINSALYAGYLAGSPSNEVVPSGYGVRITRPHSDGSDEQAKGYGGKIELFIDNRYEGTVGCDDLTVPTYNPPPSTKCFTDTSGNLIPVASDIILETYDIPSNIAVQINATYGITVIFVPPFADVIMYKDFDTTKVDFSKKDDSSASAWSLDQNTAMIFFTNRLNENTKRKIYFNRFGGVPELAKE